MATSLTTITVPGAVDFSPEDLDDGDTSQFMVKMDGLLAKLQSSLNANRAAFDELAVIRGELLAILDADDTATDVLVLAMSDRVSEIEAETLARETADADEVAARASAIRAAQNDQLNLIPHHGSFIVDDYTNDDYYDRNAEAFDALSLRFGLNGYNGADFNAATEIARYYHNSVTNSGTEPALNATAVNFANAMGIGSERYAPSFAIAETVMGAGTSWHAYNDGSSDYYLMFTTKALTRKIGIHGSVSLSYWIQSDNPIFIRGYAPSGDVTTYLDGVELLDTGGEPSAPHLHKIDTWQIAHVAHSIRTTSPAISDSFILLAKAQSKQRWACLRAAPGAFQMMPHPYPVRTKI